MESLHAIGAAVGTDRPEKVTEKIAEKGANPYVQGARGARGGGRGRGRGRGVAVARNSAGNDDVSAAAAAAAAEAEEEEEEGGRGGDDLRADALSLAAQMKVVLLLLFYTWHAT